MEGAWFLKHHKLVSLSEQELVDCAGSTGNQGCNGGEMQAAMQWIQENGGICSEDAYPYTAEDGTCQSTTCTNVANVAGVNNVDAGEAALQAAVAITPTSVAVDASGMDWQFYGGGVLNDNCGTSLDHGVLAVGYGSTAAGQAYWCVATSFSCAFVSLTFRVRCVQAREELVGCLVGPERLHRDRPQQGRHRPQRRVRHCHGCQLPHQRVKRRCGRCFRAPTAVCARHLFASAFLEAVLCAPCVESRSEAWFFL